MLLRARGMGDWYIRHLIVSDELRFTVFDLRLYPFLPGTPIACKCV
jgi:hypothetical protein